jgi:hypothetical protein
MHHLQNFSYRSLALLCRKQAALSSARETRKELQAMAEEYQRMADVLEAQSPSLIAENDRQ